MLELKNISFTVQTEELETFNVLENINLKLEDNLSYVFTGPNGGGKSSLAKIIMGIYQPTSGNVIFDGKDITNLSITERARLGIGYAFQQPPRFKGITVAELLSISSGDKPSLKECSNLYQVGLCPQDYLKRELNASLSGGEMKRIEIATLLSRNLKIAIFDEPEAGIDLWSFGKLTETFQKLKEKHDTTLVIISHQERILDLADEIILIADGKVQKAGKKEEILPSIMDEQCQCNYICQERAEKHA